MAISKQKKQQIIDILKANLKDLKIAVLVNFSGLTTEDIEILRNQLIKNKDSFKIIKNNLFKIALKDYPIKINPEIITGQIAIVFGYQDEISPAKIIYQFQKLKEKPAILGAIYENKFIAPEIVEKLAQIPQKEILYAQLVNNLNYPLANLVSALKSNLEKLVYLLNQYQKNTII